MPMKKYILISLVRPSKNDDPEQRRAYAALLLDPLHESKLQDSDKERIGESVWLLDVQKDISLLARIVTQAEAYKVEYKTQFLSEE
jgi:hypothetical protein